MGRLSVLMACSVTALTWSVACASDMAPVAVAAKPQTAVMRFFRQPVALRGSLGDVAVQVRLRVKDDYAEGLEGEYFRFGRSQQILLAGEMDADGIFIEESENGTDISGQWEGKLDGESIRGTWTSADGDVTKPFMLSPMRLPVAPKPATKKRKPTAQ